MSSTTALAMSSRQSGFDMVAPLSHHPLYHVAHSRFRVRVPFVLLGPSAELWQFLELRVALGRRYSSPSEVIRATLALLMNLPARFRATLARARPASWLDVTFYG